MDDSRVVRYDGSLPDIIPIRGGILLVGINPSLVSVKAGHYYQGRLGKRLWTRLASIGLLVDSTSGREDEAFAQSGNGLSDIVKRPTRSARELGREEREEGAALLRQKIRTWKPGLVLFSYREPAVRLIGTGVRPGQCGVVEGVRAFLLSGPYVPHTQATGIDQELAGVLRAEEGRTPVVEEVRPSARNREQAKCLQEVTGAPGRLGACRTQRVTAIDIRSGRIRLPRDAKRFFPRMRGRVMIVLRGIQLEVAYDPRTSPDRERSAVLSVGTETLRRLVSEDEILSVYSGASATVQID